MARLEELRNLGYALAEYHESIKGPSLVFRNLNNCPDLEETGSTLAGDFYEYLIDRLPGTDVDCAKFAPAFIEGEFLWHITGRHGNTQYPIGVVIGETISRDIKITMPETAILAFPDHIYPAFRGNQKVAALLNDYSRAFRELNWVSGRRNLLLPANLNNKYAWP